MNAATPTRAGALAATVVRLTGLWVLAGALGKLFFGTPKLLPPVVIDLVQDYTPWSLTFTFQFVIASEILVAGLAFLKPRYAWPILAGLMLFFDWILTRTIQGGEESCGCFGGGLDVSPWFMLTVDSALLVALLVTFPWKNLKRPGAPWWWMLVVLVIAVLAPWLKINASGGSSGARKPVPATRVVRPPDDTIAAGPTTGSETGTGTGAGTASGAEGDDPSPAGASGGGTSGDGTAQGNGSVAGSTGGEEGDAPAGVAALPDWVEFDPSPDKWPGLLIYDVPGLTNPDYGVDLNQLPVDGTVVLWRQSCDHCADHLAEMAQNDPGDKQIVLVQIQDDLDQGASVQLKPQGGHVTEMQFLEGLEFIVQTPWELHVEGGIVTLVVDPDGEEHRPR